VISLYLVGELPFHLTSWKSALNLLYGGDISKVDFNIMEKLEVICLMLNALQLSMNIIIYAVINPTFMPEFFICLKGVSDAVFHIFCITAIGRCWKRTFRKDSIELNGLEDCRHADDITNGSNDELYESEPHDCKADHSSCLDSQQTTSEGCMKRRNTQQTTHIPTICGSMDRTVFQPFSDVIIEEIWQCSSSTVSCDDNDTNPPVEHNLHSDAHEHEHEHQKNDSEKHFIEIHCTNV